ncbi:hypothetical protein F2P81_022452 [Scophthalmus maximus]|uniref:Uncharacterized protein n=1 Tax=Scophthalmus maximus TaxID=52904 RepID=A0A6A4S324_SCOMX|nr:hypothetical protein F2P81_022452 [Scophthalmus maximus]
MATQKRLPGCHIRFEPGKVTGNKKKKKKKKLSQARGGLIRLESQSTSHETFLPGADDEDAAAADVCVKESGLLNLRPEPRSCSITMATAKANIAPIFRAAISFVASLSCGSDGNDNDLIFATACNKDRLMYAHCAAELVGLLDRHRILLPVSYGNTISPVVEKERTRAAVSLFLIFPASPPPPLTKWETVVQRDDRVIFIVVLSSSVTLSSAAYAMAFVNSVLTHRPSSDSAAASDELDVWGRTLSLISSR